MMLPRWELVSSATEKKIWCIATSVLKLGNIRCMATAVVKLRKFIVTVFL